MSTKIDLTHIPNGYMCISCKNLFRDCSNLNFKGMRVIKIYKEDNLKEVKCTDFERGGDRK